MPSLAVAQSISSPLQVRLSRLADLGPADLEALQIAQRDQHRSPARREIVAEGKPIRAPRVILSGWACHQHNLPDGRRQILGFLLPGDLIGMYPQRNPIAATSILAVTEVVTCPIPSVDGGKGGLSDAYALSAVLEQRYFLAQITRLGRLSAMERVADWLLETRDRVTLAGLALGDEFAVPLTQELLADTLGMTSVHVNRTLQSLRRDGLLNFRRGTISLPDPERLENMVGYHAIRARSQG